MRLADDRLIVALDFPETRTALDLVEELGDSVSFYKIGLGLLADGGLALATRLKGCGKRVFLDLKLFDISATVEMAVSALSRPGPDFLTVHGDPHVVSAAVAGRKAGDTRVLAVTFLTSVDRDDLDDGLIQAGETALLVRERARRAFLAGADGVIAAAPEVAAIRGLREARSRLIVTPGIRPEGSTGNDQKRTAAPADAIRAGTDHIVVGRPITRARQPRSAVQQILGELAKA